MIEPKSKRIKSRPGRRTFEGKPLGPFSGLDLREQYLAGVRLPKAVLSGARLEHTKLAFANLEEANLVEAKLNLADLRGAVLTRALLCDTDMKGAVFSLPKDPLDPKDGETDLVGSSYTLKTIWPTDGFDPRVYGAQLVDNCLW